MSAGKIVEDQGMAQMRIATAAMPAVASPSGAATMPGVLR